MCGIVGFTGKQDAAPILLDGLKKLEYRGYDSAGVAVQGDGGIRMIKTRGKVESLCEKAGDCSELQGSTGIATHVGLRTYADGRERPSTHV